MKTLRYLLLVGLIVLSVLPAAVVGAKDNQSSAFSANLSVTYIGEGNVKPIGNYPDGKFQWKVQDRPISGTVASDKFNGAWQYIYSGVIDRNQAGRVHGDITITTTAGTLLGVANAELGAPQLYGITFLTPDFSVVFPVIKAPLINSQFAFTSGTGDYNKVNGNGTLNGFVYAVLDPKGEHTVAIASGNIPVFSTTGDYIGYPISAIKMEGKLLGI